MINDASIFIFSGTITYQMESTLKENNDSFWMELAIQVYFGVGHSRCRLSPARLECYGDSQPASSALSVTSS